MSRGVRDLRDLICVSRLSVRDSDEEKYYSDNSGNEGNDFTDSKLDSASNTIVGTRVVTPDSGFATAGSPGFATAGSPGLSSSTGTVWPSDSVSQEDSVNGPSLKSDIKTSIQPGTAKFQSQKKKRRRKPEKLSIDELKHDLPMQPPLPPLPSIPRSPITSDDFSAPEFPNDDETVSRTNVKKRRVNFDDMMIYLDATIVADWLTRANTALHSLVTFCNKGDNFIQFAHFWLLNFPSTQKRDIFRMEYDILLDELTLAFTVGKENGNIVRRDVLDLCGAIFKEYPLKLLSAKGSHIFLNYLDILTSEKHDQYKVLLSDVRCSTSNRQIAQWLLAMRSFAIVNVWTSVLHFYRNLTGDLQTNPIHDLWSSKEKTSMKRMMQAIRLGFIGVIHFLIANDHVNPSHTDTHGRSLIFIAVMHNQVDIVKYFVKKVQHPIDANLAADTGNTPLHAASNSGNLSIVEVLCQCDSINVNCQNSQCENATPLHLATMHGHSKIVECLLNHGADPSLKMGSSTVSDLARDFEHHDIQIQLLNR